MEESGSYEEQNMYLAEDRILSLGIYCQSKSKYTLMYVPDGVAYTDPMKDHKNLLGQRRRWINSSLFAFLYVFRNYYFNIMESDHNCIRSYITINISMIFAGLSFINSYFTPSLYFFVLYITIAQIDNSNQVYANIATIVSGIYCFVILAAIGGSLVGKQWENQAHIVSGILSFFSFAMMGLVTYNIVGIYLNLANLHFETFK
jgi:cellulose synthase/poly-beta-1,6-N-acetylglucosamine synthase-like glycosyltransferase